MNRTNEGKKIVFGGDKGGTGKTTGAVSLASSLAARGYSVALLDADTKIGAAKWHQSRLQFISEIKNTPEVFSELLPSGRPQISKTLLAKLSNTILNPILCETTTGNIHRAIVSLAAHHDFVIVDTAGGFKSELTSALTVADLFVSPIKSSSFDLQTIEEVSSLVDKMLMINANLKTICYLNEVPTNGSMDNISVPRNYIQSFPHLKVADTVIKSLMSHKNSVSFGLSVMEWDDAKSKGQMSLLTDEFLKIIGVGGK
jgi:chromosome partitioning protein